MHHSSSRPKHGGNLNWAAALAGCSPSLIVDFSASINPLGPPPSAIAAIQASLDQLVHYPDPNYPELTQALADAHQVSPDWVLPGNGSAELLTWACRELAILDSVHLITPAFGDYLRALKAFEASVQSWPLALDEPLADKLPVAPVSSASAGLLLNNPHNPTGRLWTADTIEPWLKQFALVVVDEAFMDFLWPDQQQSLIDRIERYPNLVILRSLTKFYSLPGLRLGYAIGHPDRLRRWQQWRDPWSVNVLAAAAAVAALGDTEFQQQTWAWLPEARSTLLAGLIAVPGLSPFPGAANYVLVRSDQSVVQIQRQLLQRHHVLIRDCMSFAELGDRFFRIAVRTPSENQQLLVGLTDVMTRS